MYLGKNFGKKGARKRSYPMDDKNKERTVNSDTVSAKRINRMQPKENTSKNKPFQDIKNTHIRFDDTNCNDPVKRLQKTRGSADSKVGKSTVTSEKHVLTIFDKTTVKNKTNMPGNISSNARDENVCSNRTETISNDTNVTSSNESKANNKNSNNKPKKKATNIVADITHKNSTGASNWSRFLKEQNIEIKTSNATPRADHDNNNSKTKSCGNQHTNSNNSNNNNNNNNNNSNNNNTGQVSEKTNKTENEAKLTKVVALDCEMVGVGDNGKEHMLARVSVVNSKGECLYDKFVKPKEPVVNYRTYVSGVRPEDIKNGEEFDVVQRDIAAILKNRILVGHSLKNDLTVLHLSHPKWKIRDTSKYFREQGKGTPGLKKLALEYLGVKIQDGEHSSVQDAQAAVQLYNMYRKPWEAGGGNKRSNRIKINKPTSKPETLNCA